MAAKISPASAASVPIAIVGMACRFPGGAIDLKSYWQLLRDGRNCIREVPKSRWNIDDYYDPDPSAPGKMNVRRGGFIDGVDLFDAGFFSISNREAASMDPQQRLMLMIAYEALEDAGLPLGKVAGSAGGVFVGVSADDYRVLTTSRDLVGVYGATGLSFSILANRVSYSFDLHGPSMTIDTACSSALVAVHLACESIRRGESEFALAGAVNLLLAPGAFVGMCKASFLAPDGECKSFAASANGYARGEGCGVVVLKPLERALADRDRIHAVIRGSAINQDGKKNGLTAPNGIAQEAAIRRAYAVADIEPAKVRYVEAHGTGTPLGDPIELKALGRVLGAGRDADDPCRIGSVKTNIGHLECAAGMASLIKAALVLTHAEAPRSLHFDKPNPLIPFESLKLRVQTEHGPLERRQGPLIAGVTSLGFGGTNSHVVLEEAPARARAAAIAPRAANPNSPAASASVLCLSTRQPESLRALASRYAAFLRDPQSPPLEEICASAERRRSRFRHRLAVSGSSPAALAEALDSFAAEGAQSANAVAGAARRADQIAPVFVFSGQGSQWSGMGRALYQSEPIFRAKLDEVDALLQQAGAPSIKSAMWSEKGENEDAVTSSADRDVYTSASSHDAYTSPRLRETEVAQPAIFAVQIALAALYRSRGLVPAAVIGHSVGEVAAACVAGLLSLEDAARLVCLRGRIAQEARGLGEMLAVGCSAPELESELRGSLAIAAVNSPESCVVSGTPGEIAVLQLRLHSKSASSQTPGAKAIRTRRMPMPFAFHSAQMAPLLPRFRSALADLKIEPPKIATPTIANPIRFFSTLRGARLEPRELDCEYWLEQFRQPVRFSDAVFGALADGFSTFIELGPHAVLAGDLGRCLRAKQIDGCIAFAQQRETAGELAFAASLARLFVDGADLRVNPASQTSGPDCVSLPLYPFQLARHWTELESLPASRSPTRVSEKPDRHPLLGESVPLARPEGSRVWEKDLSPGEIPFLKDHLLQGKAVMPAAAFLELALAADDDAHGAGRRQISDVEIVLPLTLGAEGSRRMQLTSSPSGVDESMFGIATIGPGETSWSLHCTGRIARGARLLSLESSAPERIGSLESARASCTEPVDPAALYRAFARAGLAYGPQFQTLVSMFRGDGEVLAELQVPQAHARYRLHPTVLDGAFQSLAALGHGDPEREPSAFVPVHLSTMDWVGDLLASAAQPAPRIFAHAVIDAAQAARAHEREARLDLYDSSGRVLARLRGFRVRRIDGPEHVDRTDPLFLREWESLELPATAAAPRSWMILTAPGAGERALGESVARLLSDQGANAQAISHLDALESALASRTRNSPREDFGLVFINDSGAENLTLTQAIARCTQALALIRLLSAKQLGSRVRLSFVTRRAENIPAESADAANAARQVAPTQALLQGLAAVVASEHPEWLSTRIDLASADQLELATLVSLLLHPPDEDALAIREHRVLAPRLIAIEHEAQRKGPRSLLRPEGEVHLAAGQPYGLATLELQKTRKAAPGAGQIDLEVIAAGLNFRDVMKSLGLYPGVAFENLWLGDECAGVVREVGPGVTSFKPGERVLALANHAFASSAIVDESLAAAIPAALSFEQAAALPVAFLTAWYSLIEVGRLQAGERVLIHAAAGGVGLAAIEIAKLVGAEVFATAGSERKRELLRTRGVQHIFDPRAPDFGAQILAQTSGRGVDVVLNSLSGDAIVSSLACLARFGRFLEIGKTDVFANQKIGLYLLRNNASFTAIDLEQVLVGKPLLAQQMLTRIVSLVDEGKLAIPPNTAFDLERAPEAFAFMQARKNIGKVILRCRAKASRVERVRGDASYLITGGLGDLGLLSAKSLVRQGARHLALIGRRAPGAEAMAVIDSLRESGVEILALEADLSREGDVQRVLATIRSRMPALRGVIHAAGIIEDATLENLSDESFARVLDAKVRGAIHLDAALAETPLDFFTLYSSVAPLLGSPGQANYAAANAFLDALAEDRRARRLASSSINWGPWAGVGMTSSNEAVQRATRLGAIERDSGAQLLDALIADSSRARTVVLPFDLAALGKIFPNAHRASLWRKLFGAGAVSPAIDRTQLLALPETEQQAFIREQLRQLFAKSLAIDVAQVLDGASPAALGVDSMIAVELKSQLESRLGIDIPALVFRSPSLREMAADLLARVQRKAAPANVATANPLADSRPAESKHKRPLMHSSSWIVPLRQTRSGPATRATFLFFPYSGAGASAYLSLAEQLAPQIEALAVQLPGREERRQEPPLRRIEEVVQSLLPLFESMSDQSLIFFGHSLGAVLAGELALGLKARFGWEPRHLVVSSMTSLRNTGASPRLRHKLSDAQLTAELLAMRAGLAMPREEDLTRHVLPPARADFEMLETYRRGDKPKLGCPITGIAASHDTLISPLQVEAWSAETTGAFQLIELEGGHLYLHRQQRELANLLNRIALGESESKA